MRPKEPKTVKVAEEGRLRQEGRGQEGGRRQKKKSKKSVDVQDLP
jgi:hypothetical protein